MAAKERARAPVVSTALLNLRTSAARACSSVARARPLPSRGAECRFAADPHVYAQQKNPKAQRQVAALQSSRLIRNLPRQECEMAYWRALRIWPPLTRARRRSVISGDANSWSPGTTQSPRLRSSLTAAARLWSLWVKRKSSISVSSSSHSEICSLSVRSPLLAIALTGKQGGRLLRPQPKRN